MFLLPLILIAIWVAGDFAYSARVNQRLRRWEAQQTWTADGIREQCESYTAGKGSEAVLLINGFGNSPRLWDEFVPELVESDLTVRAMRLPGFACKIEMQRSITYGDWVSGIENELEALRESHQRVHVVAHSLGGASVIHLLDRRPELVDRVVLLAPAIKISSARSPLLPIETWKWIGDRTLFFTRTTEVPFAPDTHRKEARDYPWSDRFTTRQAQSELMELLRTNRRIQAAPDQPTLMVLSTDDHVVDQQAAEDFFARLPHDQNRLIYAEDSGHAIPIDNDREQVLEEIIDFLQESE